MSLGKYGHVWQMLVTALGVFIMLSPALFDYDGSPASRNDRVVATLIMTFSIVAWFEATRNVRFWSIPVAVYYGVSLLVFSYPMPAAITAGVSVILVITLALMPYTPSGRYGGGWAMLFK